MKYGQAYTMTKYLYDNSPGHSWRRLNGALFQLLMAAITAHLSFLKNDFAAICSNMKGHYWMGNSCGSECGEAFYSHAVEVGHTAACISFERYAARPAALWAERVKTPERLCIGSRFTWKGDAIEVTNMKQDHLTACAYSNGNRKPRRVVRIKYVELADQRAVYDATKRKAIQEINTADTLAQLESTRERLTALGQNAFRPFDVEQITDALTKRRESLKQANHGALQAAG